MSGADYYRGMLIQRERMEAFRSAIEGAVTPGSRVVEVGSGLGTYSFFAARAGAARVTGVEGGPVIHLAREIAALNGLQVDFLAGWYPYVELPHRADVVIYEDYPARFLDHTSWGILSALQAGALEPGGTLIPGRVRFGLAPVAAEGPRRLTGPLAPDGSDHLYGLDWSPTRAYVCHQPLQAPVRQSELVAAPVRGPAVPLVPLPSPADLAVEASWTVDRETRVEGLAYWFDVEAGPGVWLTNEPERKPGSWGYLTLPLDRTWVVEAGETLRARVEAETTAGGGPGWLTWTAEAGDRRFRGHEFRSILTDVDTLARADPSWTPRLGASGRLARAALTAADGGRTLSEIVRYVVEELGCAEEGLEARIRSVLRPHVAGPEDTGMSR